jgi:DNA repair protein RadA/Sms
VRTVKNRFGPADEVGCFDLTDDGIIGLVDPSGLFLAHGNRPVPGTCVTVTMEGRRAFVTEVQALTMATDQANPRRATSGVDGSRTAMLLAVLQSRAGVKFTGKDVYAATVGGVRLVEPASDLALALAFASAEIGRAVVPGMVAIGEVGLAGELRPVSSMRARLVEAARLGFSAAIVPPDSAAGTAPIQTVEVVNIVEAITRAFPHH